VRRTVPPSAEIEQQIDQLLAVGVGENPRESLSELARLGARLIIQRAVEDEFDAWLGRARYERRPENQRGLRNYESGLRNGFRPRKVQTIEGELQVEVPQDREAAEPFVSKLFRAAGGLRMRRGATTSPSRPRRPRVCVSGLRRDFRHGRFREAPRLLG
jgi:putative transposase